MGKPAARVGDMHICPMVTPGTPPVPHVGGPVTGPGMPTVLIGGSPAAVMGDMCTCVGPPDAIVLGSHGVFIGGKPAARMGDQCAHGGMISVGFPTVLIGEIGTHHSQEQGNSCVIASSRNLIEMMTGVDVPESQLRDEMRVILGDPDHDFEVDPIDPSNASELLRNHGVPNRIERNVSNDRLAELTGEDPVLIGFPGHRVMLDSVTEDADGNRTYVVRDPDPAYNGEARFMNETEFNDARNPNAIVIVPE